MQGSGAKPYELKNTGGVYSCTCPAWRNQSLAIEKRTCKHLKKLRGEEAERARVGDAAAAPRTPKSEKRAAAQEKAAPVLLAETWEEHVDPNGWWISEKLDGMRAYWDGKQLLSRLGNVIHAPDYFVANLPGDPLDGELFLGRKSFQKTCAICRRQDKPDTRRAARVRAARARRPQGPPGCPGRAVRRRIERREPACAADRRLGTGRLGARDTAKQIVPLTIDPDPLVAHVAVNSLVALGAIDVLLAAVTPSDPNLAAGALSVLQQIHDPAVVDGLVARLAEVESSARTCSARSPGCTPARRSGPARGGRRGRTRRGRTSTRSRGTLWHRETPAAWGRLKRPARWDSTGRPRRGCSRRSTARPPRR